jgi:hypothetical protein
MRFFAVGLVRSFNLALASCLLLGLLSGCDSGGPSATAPSSGTQVTPAPAAAPLSPAEKRRTKGAAKAASGATPAGATD